MALDSLLADLVVAWRRIRKSKATSAAAIASLALGMGACLAAFQLVDALLLRPLPVAGPDRLYALSRQEMRADGPPITREAWQYPRLRALREAVGSEAVVLAISYAERAEVAFRADGEIERAQVQYASGEMFETFGLHAAAGRLLSREDDLRPGSHPVAVLSHDFWSRRFARDPKVIGQTFRMTNNLTGTRIYQIVGVAERGFTGTEPGKVVDLFLPSMMHWGIGYPGWSLFKAFVHLRPLVPASRVRERLRAALQTNDVLEMEPAGAGVSEMQKNYRIPLAALGVLVGLVLLIACANVANLMLAQTSDRGREIALRIALGAGGRRLGQLVLMEAALIGVSACGLGWCFALWAAQMVLARVNPPDNPARLTLAADWRVVVFGFLLTLGVTLLFGLAPALRASIRRPAEALKGGNDFRWGGGWMRALIGIETAFCFVVVFTAGLFVSTVDRLQGQANGFSPERLVNIDIVNPANEDSSRWDQVTDHVRRLRGVESAAYADWPLMDGRSFKTDAISINGLPPTETAAWFMNVSPGWFDTMGIVLIAGRDFNRTDVSPGVAVVNETFARQFFGQKNPLGHWFTGTSGWMNGQKFQIVGLVRDARYRYLRQPVLPLAYTPFRRTDPAGTLQGGTLTVRTTASDPLVLAPLLRSEIPRGRPEFRVSNLRTQQELIDSQTVRERLLATLARFFGAVALLLAGIGLYGVLNYSVWQRRREIGIRMALGARHAGLALSVTARSFSMVLAGAIAGCGLGLSSVRFIEPLLYQVRALDVPLLLFPALVIVGAAVLAAVPAVMRALRIDPAVLLRAD